MKRVLQGHGIDIGPETPLFFSLITKNYPSQQYENEIKKKKKPPNTQPFRRFLLPSALFRPFFIHYKARRIFDYYFILLLFSIFFLLFLFFFVPEAIFQKARKSFFFKNKSWLNATDCLDFTGKQCYLYVSRVFLQNYLDLRTICNCAVRYIRVRSVRRLIDVFIRNDRPKKSTLHSALYAIQKTRKGFFCAFFCRWCYPSTSTLYIIYTYIYKISRLGA